MSSVAGVPFNQLSPLFSPLDLIYFRGTDVVSDLICILEKKTLGAGDYSHVGLLVNSEVLPTVPQLIPGEWYVWESTMSAVKPPLSHFADGVPNIETGEGRFGVQIRHLPSVVNYYTKDGGKMAWAQLIDNPWTRAHSKDRPKLAKKISAIHEELGNRSYNMGCLSLLGAIFPAFRKPRDDFNKLITEGYEMFISWTPLSNPAEWLFCSELAAGIYQRLDLIPLGVTHSDTVPMDFLGYDKDGLPKMVRDPVRITIS